MQAIENGTTTLLLDGNGRRQEQESYLPASSPQDYLIRIEPIEHDAEANGHFNGEEHNQPNRVVIEMVLNRPEDGKFCQELVRSLKTLIAPENERASSPVLRFEDLELNTEQRTVTRAGKQIWLTPREYSVSEYFLRRPNRILTRDNIGERVWGLNHMETSNLVDVYVSRIRKKLDTGFSKRLLHTVVGFGYVLSAEGPPAA
jgi:DNA-binding winged helix-turn-helix (wHTH) protein